MWTGVSYVQVCFSHDLATLYGKLKTSVVVFDCFWFASLVFSIVISTVLFACTMPLLKGAMKRTVPSESEPTNTKPIMESMFNIGFVSIVE